MSHTAYDMGDPDFPTAADLDQHHEFRCDVEDCATVFEEVGDFIKVWNEAKEEGWKCRKNTDGDWVHACPRHAGQLRSL